MTDRMRSFSRQLLHERLRRAAHTHHCLCQERKHDDHRQQNEKTTERGSLKKEGESFHFFQDAAIRFPRHAMHQNANAR